MWMALLALAGCSAGPARLAFVRDGVVGPSGFVARAWTPGEKLDVEGVSGVAPERPECVALFSVPLGDVSRTTARGAEPPDTAMAWSPDGSRLAIGSGLGEVIVVDGWTGDVVVRRTLPEAVLKAVAWSPDGRTLYAGEQSPDAYLRAMDADTLADRWTARLADDVGTSPMPAGDDLYGVYTLPGVFGLVVLDGGDVVVSAVHGWAAADGTHHDLGRLIRLHADGTRAAAFPADAAAPITLFHPRVDVAGGVLVAPVGASEDDVVPADLPVDGLLALDVATLTPRRTVKADPLAPWFSRTFVWESADVSAGADAIVAGYGDGRVLAWRLSDGSPRARLDLGTPIVEGDVPVAATVGFARLVGDEIASVTSGTSIPYGAADPALRPPAPHPNENAVWVHSVDGDLVWTWRGPQALQGLTASPDGRTLVVGAGERSGDTRTDLFGALVFRLDGDGSGEDRLEAFCPTASPVWFRQAPADDGRIAVAEHPYKQGEDVRGEYRVTVLR